MQACLEYPWPGNLRELNNFVKRYLVLGDENLAVSELQPERTAAGGTDLSPAQSRRSRRAV